MKVLLMFRNRNFQIEKSLPSNSELLIEDLGLSPIFKAMARDDEFFLEVVRCAFLSPLNDMEDISYRQEILKDCLKNPNVIKEMYNVTLETEEVEKKTFFGFFNKYVTGILDSSVSAMEMLVASLKKLRKLAYEHSKKFNSDGFAALFERLKAELSDDYFNVVETHLKNLRFNNGMLIGAKLGKGNKGTDYMLLKPNEEKRGWIKRVFSKKDERYTFRIADRDEAGAKALMELQERGLNSVANALAQSVDHILGFFKTLKAELAFYLGAMNLHDFLTSLGMPITFPIVKKEEERIFDCKELYDPSLAIVKQEKVVGNSITANGKSVFVITGANQGGKTTFLRSVGIAQLMAQSGLFVAAKAFHTNIANGIFTHFRKEEDKEMESGKFDEELRRLDEIVDHVHHNSIILFNESFAATNEFEGSEIAYQVVKALSESNVKIFFVTHMYEFAHRLEKENHEDTFFLRAERLKDGRRTYRLTAAPPQRTSYGEDLYKKVFNVHGVHR